MPDYRRDAPVYYDMESFGEKIPAKDFEHLIGHKLIENSQVKKGEFTLNSTLSDIRITFVGEKLYQTIRSKMFEEFKVEDERQKRMAEAMVEDLPIRSVVLMGGGALNFKMAEGLIDLMNGKIFKGTFKVIKNRSSK